MLLAVITGNSLVKHLYDLWEERIWIHADIMRELGASGTFSMEIGALVREALVSSLAGVITRWATGQKCSWWLVVRGSLERLGMRSLPTTPRKI